MDEKNDWYINNKKCPSCICAATIGSGVLCAGISDATAVTAGREQVWRILPRTIQLFVFPWGPVQDQLTTTVHFRHFTTTHKGKQSWTDFLC